MRDGLVGWFCRLMGGILRIDLDDCSSGWEWVAIEIERLLHFLFSGSQVGTGIWGVRCISSVRPVGIWLYSVYTIHATQSNRISTLSITHHSA